MIVPTILPPPNVTPAGIPAKTLGRDTPGLVDTIDHVALHGELPFPVPIADPSAIHCERCGWAQEIGSCWWCA